jgi:hypothetical protein
MAYIEILPKSTEAQQRLTDHCATVMNILYRTTKEVLDIPEHDIIIELNQCTAIVFNATAVQAAAVPDVVIKISSSDLDLQSEFQTLCDQVVARWDAEFGNTLKLELWIDTINTWGCNMDFSQENAKVPC